MKDFWNDRYASEAYAYGETPNAFFKQEIQYLKPGKLLFPAEGEGRNAVYAASLGWDVTAFDISIEGKLKAEKLAKKSGVKINYIISDFSDIEFENDMFDCVVLIFAHTHPNQRQHFHRLTQKWLKPDGTIILQGFSKNQIYNNSGGPQNIDMLFDKNILLNDFNQLISSTLEEADVNLNEGLFHKGKSSLINFVGKKMNMG